MRINFRDVSTRMRGVVAGLAMLAATASSAAAQTTVHLIAAPTTKSIALPNGTVVAVPMWGYAFDVNGDGVLNGESFVDDNANGTWDMGEAFTDSNGNGVWDALTDVVTVPGPQIVVPAGTTSLTVVLQNLLPEATSIVVAGQTPGAAAAPVDGRIRSMTAETAPGGSGTYAWNNLKPGTFLYESGSHPAVQVQMGLYGAMLHDAAAGQAYAGVGYAHQAVLVYSEIDTTLHDAVNNGTYGTPAGPTSTIDYRPSIFLVNGESYREGLAAIEAGTAGETTLLRVVNASLRTHAPQVDNGAVSVVAEDGNALPFARNQATVMLAAGKTHDLLWTPAAPGTFSVYDRMLGLNASPGPNMFGQGNAGMLARLRIGAAAGSGDSSGLPVADDGAASGVEDAPAIGGTVTMHNATAAQLVTSPHAGALTFDTTSGAFSYQPNPDFAGVDSFTFRATNGVDVSAPATVTITVSGVNDAPVAAGQQLGLDIDGNATVNLAATDADGDALKYYLTSLPNNGELSYIDPLTKIDTPIQAADLHTPATLATQKAIPGGVVIYTPTAGYVGSDFFSFVAFDGAVYSASADVSADIHDVETSNSGSGNLTQPITLSVRGADGSTISNYRWTLEEDRTYKVVPGIADPNTLAVKFHTSYMPVVAAGNETVTPKVDPTKRYFVSVLPTENNYSNSGAEIEVGQTTASVTVSKLPLPTARIRVQVFQDNAPLNGMWDSTEPGLAGFQVTIDDAGGTYGMSGGHQSTDAFGNKIGTKYTACPDGTTGTNATTSSCTGYEVAQPGDGFVLTDADGYAVVENLVMGKYTVKVRAPGGERWIQTTTIEGQPGIDAWVKPNEPQYFTEFGPPGPHVMVGFTRAETGAGVLGAGTGPWTTITGRVTNLRQSRPPAVAQFSGAPYTHTRPWVALNAGATGGVLLYTQPTNEDGTFSIAGVPTGSYELVVFDQFLDLIIGSAVVNVAADPLTGTVPSTTDVHDVATFNWFTNLYSYVYDDANGNGVRDEGEEGIPDQALNIRFRDGSIYQSLATGETPVPGFKAFNEVFPFFAWMIAEVDYTRYHSTGLTVAVDDGGDASAAGSNAYDWQQQMGFPLGVIPPETLNPQLQAENGNKPFRTESGAGTPFLLLEGFQGFIGQSTVMMWGKAPYATPGSKGVDVNYAPFDTFDPTQPSEVPCPASWSNTDKGTYCIGGFLHDINADGNVDADGNPIFDQDHYNGGIAGIVHYGITRAENDPRWAVAENWDPGVADVPVELWDANRAHLLNNGVTDNFNRNGLEPTGCQWPSGAPWNGNYVYLGRTTDCFDGLRNFNQARPAVFDGGYAFSSILADTYDPRPGHEGDPLTFDKPLTCDTVAGPCSPRGAMLPIPAGKYVVKVTVPDGYVLQKEEDKNVDFGDTYVPQQFWLGGYPLGDEGPSVLTSLTQPMTVEATTATVADARSIHPNDQIVIDDEIMRVTAVVGNTLTVLRGQGGASGDTGSRIAVAHTMVPTDVIDFGAQLVPTAQDNALIAPFCVGKLHQVPNEFSLFPGDPNPYGGEMRPLCDAKLVTLRDGQQAAPDFHFFTEAPIAGHIYGMVLDDTTNEFDPNAPTFGEKYAPPFIGVAIRDWQGNEIARTYTDQYGIYNALVPTTYTINPPEPSGVSPSILSACINPPTMPGPNGTVVPDPHFQKQYSHFCYPLQYLPGKTTYLDTPVVPTGAFTGNGTFPVDAELPDQTPVIAMATGPDPDQFAAGAAPSAAQPYGPYVVNRGPGGQNSLEGKARTILLTSAASLTNDGLTEVANPAYDGAGGLNPKLIKRDYGFGATAGQVLLTDPTDGSTLVLTNLSWSNKQITALLPGGARTGLLSVVRNTSFCTANDSADVSTVGAPMQVSDLILQVAAGDGYKFLPQFASSNLLRVGSSEVMAVNSVATVGTSTLAEQMNNTVPDATTGAQGVRRYTTLRMPNGAGATAGFVPGPLSSVLVDNEVMRLLRKTSTKVRVLLNVSSSSTATLAVTNGEGSFKFLGDPVAGDYITVDGINPATGLPSAEVMLVTAANANTLTVLRAQLGTVQSRHDVNAAVTANDRYDVTRGVTTASTHAIGAAARGIGDSLDVARAQEGTEPIAYPVGTGIKFHVQTCVTDGTRKSTLGITMSVATPTMHTLRPPKFVSSGQSIQAAIDAADPGDLLIVRPGVYEQMVVMTKPIRLQGSGALTTAINVVTTPAENIQAWMDKVGNLLLSTPQYFLPNQPAMTPAPFQSGDVAAVLGDEGPGVLVLGKRFPNSEGPTNGGRCRVEAGSGQNTYNNFAQRINDAYCLVNENYEAANGGNGGAFRPNARIDGFSIIGASNAAGVMVNGYAHWLQVSNNKIFTNSGTYGGGINVGHAGSTFGDDDAQNDNITISNNMVTQNASVEAGGGGGIVLGSGSDGYRVKNNFVAANLSSGNGGGISHVGHSDGGVIDANAVVFNESFFQAITTNGGGIYVGGTPAAAGGLTLGAGNVSITNNLIQGNGATGGDGGGVALNGVNGADLAASNNAANRYHVSLYNNMIVNNVAGLAGGGISIADAAYVDITHNTIANNDSTGTAGAAFVSPLTSAPQPAGIVARGFTPAIAGFFANGPIGPAANPRVMVRNSIVRGNRTFYYGACTLTSPCGPESNPIVPVSPTPGSIVYGEKVVAGQPYWDFGVLGGSGRFHPWYSIVTALSGAATANVDYSSDPGNTTTVPPFVRGYVNTDRRQAYQVGETNGEATLISTPAALDEGGNFIRPQFGPLSLERPKGSSTPFFGNYHVTAGENGLALGSPTMYDTAIPGALLTDFDGQVRDATAHKGADQVVPPIPSTPVPQR